MGRWEIFVDGIGRLVTSDICLLRAYICTSGACAIAAFVLRRGARYERVMTGVKYLPGSSLRYCARR